jgi:hypothetical protein
MGRIIQQNNGKTTVYVTGENLTGLTPESNTYYLGVDLSSGVLEKKNPNGTIVNLEDSGETFTGGTVNGATVFTNGLTSNTISATTYLNLPGDIYITGGTYSAGTLTLTSTDSNDIVVSGFTTGNGKEWTGGTNYILVKADGTPLENGTAALSAYNELKTMSPTSTNRLTLVLAPGEYQFPSTFIMDTEFIDLVSLTGNRDVIFDLGGITDPFSWDTNTGDIITTSECLLINVDNVYVKGIKGKFYLSPGWDDYWTVGEDYILPIQVANNLPNIVVENCEGGPFSFGGDITFGSNIIILNGTFINCKGNTSSFVAWAGDAAGTFIDCESVKDIYDESYSFGGFNAVASGYFKNCKAGSYSFGGQNGDATGVFINCESVDSSFGGYSPGTFTNCSGQDFCFGSFNGFVSGYFENCKAGSYSFGGPSSQSTGVFINCIAKEDSFGGGSTGIADGTFVNCVGGDNSFGGGNGAIASGIFEKCIGGENSFGGGISSSLTGKLYYCRLINGLFKTPTSGGKIILGIDGNDDIINES